ncbi:MAG: FixH family protein [Bacteroidota bacterium]
MKINWGTGIAIFYVIFVLSLVYQVYKSTQYDVNLVAEDYYAKDLAYQQQYEKLVNAQELKEPITIEKDKESGLVNLSFPEDLKEINGNIHFFCPSDNKQDFIIPLQLHNHNQKVPTDGLKKGLWKVKVDFTAGTKGFFKESAIVI